MLDDKNIIHVVIDIETLGTVQSLAKHGTCPILEAGFAVVEYCNGEWVITKANTTTFSLANQCEHHADESVMEWHTTKSKDNYVEILRLSLEAPLNNASMFATHITDIIKYADGLCKEVHYWSQGKDFDYTILSAYAIQNNFTYPFMRGYNFTKIHCLRDLIAFSGHKTGIKNSNPHRAFDDAVFEASVLAEILNNRSK